MAQKKLDPKQKLRPGQAAKLLEMDIKEAQELANKVARGEPVDPQRLAILMELARTDEKYRQIVQLAKSQSQLDALEE